MNWPSEAVKIEDRDVGKRSGREAAKIGQTTERDHHGRSITSDSTGLCPPISLPGVRHMGELPVFSTSGARARHGRHRSFRTEAELRHSVVQHASLMMSVCVLSSEYPVDRNGGERINALGIDAKSAPLVFEYKRTASGVTICRWCSWLIGRWAADDDASRSGTYSDLIDPLSAPGSSTVTPNSRRLRL